jgi:hypothetical protein
MGCWGLAPSGDAMNEREYQDYLGFFGSQLLCFRAGLHTLF